LSASSRAWFVTCVVALVAISLVQAREAWLWARAPWPGFTVLGHGRISYRYLEELPQGVRALGDTASLQLEAVRAGDEWLPLSRPVDAPGAPQRRLTRAMDTLSIGPVIDLRIRDAGGGVHETTARLRRLDVWVAIERTAVFFTMGLLIAAFGLWVFHARPDSREALAFAVIGLAFGLESVLGQVEGGYPTRFSHLSHAMRYATPAAAVMLVLCLARQERVARRPWLLGLPWIVALACGLFDEAFASLAAAPSN
jgi:hypothetical protein